MAKRRGFTLIELLIVIGIIAILAAIIYVSVDPAKRFAQARNARRWASVNSILNAVLKYTVDNDGDLPSTATAIDDVTGSVQILGNGGIACAGVTCTGQSVVAVNCFADGLDNDLVDKYLSAIPLDPKTGSTNNTRYFINRTANDRILVGACDEEAVDGVIPTIEVSR